MRRWKRLGFEDLESRLLLHGGPSSGIQDPDVNGDGRVDLFDINLVSQRWGTRGPVGDANGDGTVDIFDINLVGAHFTDSLPHSTDAVKQEEHLELFSLVNRGEATAVAHESGLWSDPDIWVGGRLPGAGDKVLVPRGVAVTVDGVYTDKIAWMRVDGTLQFSTDRDTQLTVDTLVGSATSVLLIDTPQPFTTRIVIADRGPIDTTWDPFALSRGIVWHGAATIHGAETAPYAFATGDLAAGQRQFSVTDSGGWQVGDRLLIASTSLLPSATAVYPDGLDQDDDLRIVAIVGNVVTLDRPLAFNHIPLDGHLPVIENLTRNVTVTSENTADLGRRGHVMFMHNPNVDIAYAAFVGLGRTDKVVTVTDPDGQGHGLENVRGRYALHFHRTGANLSGVPVVVKGVAIVDSPGWGLVNHESYVLADDNVAYNVAGAAFVTETGNELGEFKGNVAVRSHGGYELGQAGNDRGNNDLAHNGHGFWLNGSLVSVENNIAVGHSGAAFFFFGGLAIISRYNLPDPSILPPGVDRILSESVPVLFRNNFAYGSGNSLTAWGLGNPALQPTYSLFEDNTLYGTVLEGYSGQLEFRNNRILGNGDSYYGVVHTGVNFDVRFVDNTITGFQVGLLTNTEGTGEFIGGYYDNHESNFLIQNTQQNRPRSIDINGPQFGATATWNVNMSVDFFSFDISAIYPLPGYAAAPTPDVALLFSDRGLGAASTVRLNGERLYFDEQGPDFQFGELLTRALAELRYNPDGTSTTTGDLWRNYHLSVGNTLVPDDAHRAPGVRGWLTNSAAIEVSDVTLLSRRATPLLSGYVAHVRDSSGNDIYSQPTDLLAGRWNVVTVMVEGLQRGVLVFGVNDEAITSHWGTSAIEGDANGDGVVDIFDINSLATH